MHNVPDRFPQPFENPNADPHPFVPNLYQVRGTQEADKLNSDADSLKKERDGWAAFIKRNGIQADQ